MASGFEKFLTCVEFQAKIERRSIEDRSIEDDFYASSEANCTSAAPMFLQCPPAYSEVISKRLDFLSELSVRWYAQQDSNLRPSA
jgi:hypothetical protein